MPVPAEKVEQFREDYKTLTDSQLSVKYGVPRSTIYGWRKQLDLADKTVSKGAISLPEIPDPNDPVLVDDLLQRVIDLQRTQQALTDVVKEAAVTIKTDTPIGLLFWGDWHIGGIGTDHQEFRRMVAEVAETDNLYFVGMGDYKDNLSVSFHQGASFEEVTGPRWQEKIVIENVTKLTSKSLAYVEGNHDHWTKRMTDSDFVSYLCQLSKSVNLGPGGTLLLTVGSVTYRIYLRHDYPYKSSLNPSNSQRKQIWFQGEADIVAHAHRHFAQVDHGNQAGREWIGIRSGTHKVYDEYGQRIAGWEGMQRFPMVVLFPDEKCMVPFKDYRQGLRYLASCEETEKAA